MSRFVAAELCKKFTSVWRSWSYVNDSFAGDFQALEQSGNLRMDGAFPVIWKTNQKFVIKGTAPSGKIFAYKSYRKIKGVAKYFFRLSPCGMEAMNFQRITRCNIPLPKLLAVGDTRKNAILKTAYLITEFAEGYSDGRDFTYLTEFAVKDKNLLNEFILRNMELLARLHDNNILHRGFTPANLLYKVSESNDGNALELKWIDVASCRRMPRWLINKNIADDMQQLFRFFEFESSQLLEFIELYCAARKSRVPAAGKILSALEKILAARRAAKAAKK